MEENVEVGIFPPQKDSDEIHAVPPKEQVITPDPIIEERPDWGEFQGGQQDEVGRYKKPTPEQKETFEKRIERISEIFENADFSWYLDGATNISLYRGELIRDHKDLDISIFREDLARLEALLTKQGFGIFVNFDENGKRLMKKVTTKDLSAIDNPDISICKVTPDGKIQRQTTDPFNFVDLYIHSKDAEGNTIIFYNGAILPKEFFYPVKKDLPNGKKINLSQPAIVAYHKLHSNRSYDLTDLQELRPYLQTKDFTMLRAALESELDEIEIKIGEILQEAWDLLSPMLKLTHDQKIISEILLANPEMQKRKEDQKAFEFIPLISEYISKNPEITFKDFSHQSLVILKPQEQIEQKLKFLNQLEKI